MLARLTLISALLMLPATVGAQLGPAPERDACGEVARRVGAAAARVHGWSTAEPRARPIGMLEVAVIWLVQDNPRCCSSAECSASSERADALVASLGERLFVLTGAQPHVDAASGRRLTERLVADEWTSLVRASGAQPENSDGALALGWLIYASLFPGRGRVDDVASFDPELADRARTFGSLRPSARRRRGGYEVVLWAARRSSEGHVRDRGMGSSGDERLRRAVVRIHGNGRVVVEEDVSITTNTRTMPARVIDVPATSRPDR